jgi:hypothetical protein
MLFLLHGVSSDNALQSLLHHLLLNSNRRQPNLANSATSFWPGNGQILANQPGSDGSVRGTTGGGRFGLRMVEGGLSSTKPSSGKGGVPGVFSSLAQQHTCYYKNNSM